MIKLAIVIPYYKIKYFEESLLSIKNQTNKRFKLYIGNDNSPECPVSLINQIFIDQENIVYKHFNFNLGARALTRQWERCINLSTEEYIWLFSDDDLMPLDAVERFYDSLEFFTEIDLFRFNVQVVNELKQPTWPVTQHPLFETAISFLNKRLKGETISTACEYIFSRRTYLAHQGFVEFPLGWASDDATWLNFASGKGINLIPGDCVCWRMGGNNISSQTNNYKKKAIACVGFIKFISAKYTVENNLKLTWLIHQMSLLGNGKKTKIYFWAHILISNVFPISFVYTHLKKYLQNLLTE